MVDAAGLTALTGGVLALCLLGGLSAAPSDTSAVPQGAPKGAERWTDDLRAAIRARREGAVWQQRDFVPRLPPAVLQVSLAKAREFLLNAQKPEGHFNYEYDFSAGKFSGEDNQARQAGALRGVALLHAAKPTDRTRAALDRGLGFFFRHSRPARGGGLAVAYPGDEATAAGTVALVALTLIEYLRADDSLPAAARAALNAKLDDCLAFLKAQQQADGTFSARYILHNGVRSGARDRFSGGEALLAFCKAARYLGRKELLPRIRAATATMISRYLLDAWQREADPAETKEFYQWGTMSFWECYDAGWSDGEACADAVLAMAGWMIHTHSILDRKQNTASVHEGLVHAYRVARSRKDRAAMSELHYVIDRGLYQLITWQVGGPLEDENPFLVHNPTRDPRAAGGVMNAADEPRLRIDVTQHHCHALLLALRYVYR